MTYREPISIQQQIFRGGKADAYIIEPAAIGDGMNYKLIGDDKCFVCGTNNPSGLKIPFELDKARKTIRCAFTPGPEYQGFKGITHGGIIATLLDEAMVKLAFELGISAVTAWMEVRYIAPLMTGEKVYISATITKEVKNLLEATAEAFIGNGNVIVRAKGKLIIPPL